MTQEVQKRPESETAAGALQTMFSPDRGALIINADDWGRNVVTTDRILDCFLNASLSSTSAMVFMADSERGAELAKEHNLDAGLHLNFTSPFDAAHCSAKLKEKQEKIGRFLLSHRYSRVVFMPTLATAFEYVVAAQLEEYERVYGYAPLRIDGHHHMHLSANVLYGELMPAGTIVRRNHSFQPGQRSIVNRVYRRWLDRMVTRRYRTADGFYILPPTSPPKRLTSIFSLANRYTVEVETHPVDDEDYEFLMGDGLARCLGSVSIARGYCLQSKDETGSRETVK